MYDVVEWVIEVLVCLNVFGWFEVEEWIGGGGDVFWVVFEVLNMN